MATLGILSAGAVLLGLAWLLKLSFGDGNKIAAWLLLLLVGMAAIMSGQLEEGLAEKVAINVWAFLVVGLPLYWTIRFIVRSWRS